MQRCASKQRAAKQRAAFQAGQHVIRTVRLRYLRSFSVAHSIALAAIGGHAALLLGMAAQFHPYLQAQWLFNYRGGFIRRGLLGQVVVLLPGEPQGILPIAAGIVLAGVLGMLTVWAAQASRALRSGARPAFVLFVAIAPFAGGYFALDFGRTDQLNLLAMMASMLLLSSNRSPARLLAATLLAVAGILVHEAYALMCAPLVAALLAHRVMTDRWSSGYLLLYCLGTAAALAAAIVVGHPLLPPSEQWRRMVGPDRPLGPIEEYAVMLAYRSIGENIAMTVKQLAEPATMVQYLLAWIYALPALFVLLRLMKRSGQVLPHRIRQGMVWVGCASTATLMLSALGHDFPRWLAMTLFNVLVTLLWAMRAAPVEGISLSTRDLRLLWGVIALYALGGPLDDTGAGWGPNLLLEWARSRG